MSTENNPVVAPGNVAADQSPGSSIGNVPPELVVKMADSLEKRGVITPEQKAESLTAHGIDTSGTIKANDYRITSEVLDGIRAMGTRDVDAKAVQGELAEFLSASQVPHRQAQRIVETAFKATREALAVPPEMMDLHTREQNALLHRILKTDVDARVKAAGDYFRSTPTGANMMKQFEETGVLSSAALAILLVHTHEEIMATRKAGAK